MGLIRNILGLGGAVRRVAEVFIPNRSKSQEYEYQEFSAALEQYGAEFKQSPEGGFNGFVNGLNRLPRPVLALGTVGLFVFAMIDPAAFSRRMIGLNTVPRELWWLLGAIVSFYFGAREMHYQRAKRPNRSGKTRATATPAGISAPEDNAAVADWMVGDQR